MKKITLYLLTFFLILILTACGGEASETNSNSGNDAANERSFETPMETQLMLGTVILEETAYAIDSDQADRSPPLVESPAQPVWK